MRTLPTRSEAKAARAALDTIPAPSEVAPETPPPPAQSPDALTETLMGSGKKPPLFTTAHGTGAPAGAGPHLSPDFERILTFVYMVDAAKDFEEIVSEMEIGDQRGDYGTVRMHQDKAEDRARRAHALYLSAKLEKVKFDASVDVVEGAMRAEATNILENEKAAGERKKAITESDVAAKMCELHPDEYQHNKVRRAQVDGLVDHMLRLAELWKGRAYSLASAVTALRK